MRVRTRREEEAEEMRRQDKRISATDIKMGCTPTGTPPDKV